MIKFENTEVFGWDAAIRGMRNPMNSWDKSDSGYCGEIHCSDCPHEAEAKQPGSYCIGRLTNFVVGKQDLQLMKKLIRGGTDHSKFMRMINVVVDITAPRYWWTEFDTYKVGTVRNSCSTMHKIHAKEFTLDDFSCEHLTTDSMLTFGTLISELNHNREDFLETKDKDYWWQMIQLLPQSYNQRATVQLNYAVLRSIYHSDRKHHKLDEWRIGFMEWIESLPYSELITGDFF